MKNYLRIGRESGFWHAIELAIADTKRAERRRCARIVLKSPVYGTAPITRQELADLILNSKRRKSK